MSAPTIPYEIIGCNPKNLGDLLMLDATISALSGLSDHLAPALRSPRTLQRSSFAENIKLIPVLKDGGNRLRQKRFWNDWLFHPGSRFLSSISGKCVAFADLKITIDVCGYKYGGIWGSKNLREDLERYKRLKRSGHKIILLPKTFGPFSDPEQKK